MKKALCALLLILMLLFSACVSQPATPNGANDGSDTEDNTQTVPDNGENNNTDIVIDPNVDTNTDVANLPSINAGVVATEKSKYTDTNGDIAIIPAQFTVSAKSDEQTVNTGLVIIGTDGSEFVWIPTTQTELKVRDFGSYFSGGSINSYYDETELAIYKNMVKSCELYGGFYMGRFEASRGA